MWRVRGWGSRYETDRTWYCPSVSLTTFILNILEKQKKWLWQMSDWNCILYSFLLYIFPASFSFRPLPICCQSFSEMNNCNRDKPRSLLLATPPPPPPRPSSDWLDSFQACLSLDERPRPWRVIGHNWRHTVTGTFTWAHKSPKNSVELR